MENEMRAGGGKDKGSSFERLVCRELSLWITDNAFDSIFTRNIISGGQFTNRIKSGHAEHGQPGDVMARDPLANEFLSLFLVECKFHKDIHLDTYIFDTSGRSPLAKIIAKCRMEAEQHEPSLSPILIVKQNRQDPFILLGEAEGEIALRTAHRHQKLDFNTFKSFDVYMFVWKEFRSVVNAKKFIHGVMEF
jgi:hypothetical protein